MAKQQKYDWKEYPDPTPVELPVGLKSPETMDQKIRRIVATQISAQAFDQGKESFEESNDFDIKDDFETDEPLSGHEVIDMMPEYPADLQENIINAAPDPEDEEKKKADEEQKEEQKSEPEKAG